MPKLNLAEMAAAMLKRSGCSSTHRLAQTWACKHWGQRGKACAQVCFWPGTGVTSLVFCVGTESDNKQ